MALLSQMIRSVAITGDVNRANAWFADRQGKEWAERTVRAAFPREAAPRPDPSAQLEQLAELRRRGVVTEAEADALRGRLGV